MTAIDTPVVQSIQQAIDIIRQGRELERLLLEAGFALPDVERQPAAPVPPPNAAPEWPRTNDDGEMVDVRGLLWDERIHASSKACSVDGIWRRKRGADPELVAHLESEALARLTPSSEPATGTPDPYPTEEDAGEPASGPAQAWSFEQILDGIRSADDQNQIDWWEDYSRIMLISDSQRMALQAAAAERQRQWQFSA